MGNPVISNQAQLDLLPGRMKGQFAPAASATPPNNGDAIMQYASNQQLSIKSKGTDGIVRDHLTAYYSADKLNVCLGTYNDPVFNAEVGEGANNLVAIGIDMFGVGTPGVHRITDSVVIGSRTCNTMVNGNGNLAIGNLVLTQQPDANHQTALGDSVFRYLTTGGGNFGCGYRCGEGLITASSNVLAGTYNTVGATEGDENTILGGYGGAHDVTAGPIGNRNNIVGYSGYRNGEGFNNNGMGFEVLLDCYGDQNLALGDQAGRTLTQVVLSTDLVISSVATQTSLVLTGGPGINHTGIRVSIKDASNGNKRYVTRGNWNAGTNTLTLTTAVPITIVASDLVTLARIPKGNIHLGQRAGFATGVQKPDAVNSISIGNDTYCESDNEIVIGNIDHTKTTLRGNMQGVGRITFTQDVVGTPPANVSIYRVADYMIVLPGSNGFFINDHTGTHNRFSVTTAGLVTIHAGTLQVNSIPTSAPGSPGRIWSDAGTLKITS
jgi:hypothetical protein